MGPPVECGGCGDRARGSPRGLRHVVAAHLSEQNNRPDIVRRLMAEALGGHEAEMLTANASEGSPWLDV
jgi:integrase